jgi:TolB-like protein
MIQKIILLFIIFSNLVLAQTRTTIAVMDLSAAGVAETDAQVITSRLRTDLFNTKKYIVLERDKVNEVLNEQGFQQSMCTTNECVVEVGKLIGVQQMVAGEIGKVGNLFTITIRLIDVENGEVLKTATEDCECKIEQVVTQSVKNVAEILAGNKIQTSTYSSSKNLIKNSELSEWVKFGMSREEYFEYKNSGLTLERWNKYNIDQKGAFTQGLKSFLFPGWGQLSLDRKRGYTYLGIEIIGWVGLMYSFNKQSNPEDQNEKTYYKNTITPIFLGIVILNHVVSTIDAGYTVPHYNEELKKKYKLSLTPKLNKYSKQPMLSLNINF